MPALNPRAQGTSEGMGRRGMAALVVLQLGALAVVLATTPFKPFELDRFFVPKELALHVTALLAGGLCLTRLRTVKMDRVDMILSAYLLLSFVSALLAPNRWLSTRAFAVTLSGLVIFWCARALGSSGLRRPIMAVIVLSATAGAASALAQAYGLETEYFTLSRAPGGTFGNRNFMAHLSAIGAPLVIWYAITARRAWAVFLCALAAAVLSAGLVLSRSRAAWLALLVVGVLVAIPMWRAARNVPHADSGRRIMLLVIVSLVGAAVALALPNRLNWKSDSPYLDSVRGVVDYNSGSGRGRIIQYRNTLHMVQAHPVFGVGPGNWPVYYARFASRNDPSLSREDGMTANPWPSSDWAALVAERGPLAVLVLIVGVIGLIANSFRSGGGHRAGEQRDPFLAVAVTATVLITAAVGMFDAVLLLATPTLIVWGALGALSTPGRTRFEWTPAPGARRRALVATLAVLFLFTLRSAGQTIAMNVYGSGTRLSSVTAAALWDPGSYRIQMRLAELGMNSRGCSRARPHAARAAEMFPTAAEPRGILRRCAR